MYKRQEESIQPRYQANVYACEDFEASLPRHTRRLIKDAVKRDVRVVRAGKEQIQAFSDVVALKEKRKNVSMRNHCLLYTYSFIGVVAKSLHIR